VTLTKSDVTELLDAIRAGGDIDVIRKGVELVLQALIEAEATEVIEVIGAGRNERAEGRSNWRNGTRDRLLVTKAGDVGLKIPKLRRGSFFPSILERRRRIDRALFAVVMEAYVHGVSTRKVDDLVAALGAGSGISKSEVSRICTALDAEMAAFRARPLGHVEFPYVFLDATYLKGRVGGQVVSRAVVVATGVGMNGDREVLGCAVGDSEDEAFWITFLRSVRERGLTGLRLVISDHHLGLKKAIATVMLGSAWQRCRVHFMRNILARVPRANAEMVAAAIRTIFPARQCRGRRPVRPDRGHARGPVPCCGRAARRRPRGPAGVRAVPA
jgi:transposase-like protein